MKRILELAVARGACVRAFGERHSWSPLVPSTDDNHLMGYLIDSTTLLRVDNPVQQHGKWLCTVEPGVCAE